MLMRIGLDCGEGGACVSSGKPITAMPYALEHAGSLQKADVLAGYPKPFQLGRR
jgi:hypothetical protein